VSATTAVRRVAPPGVLPRLLSDDDLGPLVVPRDLVDVLRAAGLRGRGGAAFPTADKLDAVVRQHGRPIVVANVAEGEPASSKDRALARVAPHLLLDGVVAAAAVLGAHRAVVALAESAAAERLAVERALAGTAATA
jgi:NADH:ubiquinone oxidoreductase subunit F (NADH-binding)